MNDEAVKARRGASRVVVILLCIIAALSVLLFGAVDAAMLSLMSVFIAALVLIWTWDAFRKGRFYFSSDLVQLPLVALALVGLIQLLPLRDAGAPDLIIGTFASSLSLDPYATRFFLMRLFLYIVFFAAALTFINTPRILKATVIFLIILGSILAFYSILQRVETPDSIYGLRTPGQANPFGTYVNRHHFAGLMEMIVGLAAGLLFARALAKGHWPFLAVGAVVMAIAIVMTGSRGGMFALLAILTANLAMSIRFGKTPRDHLPPALAFVSKGPGLVLAAAAFIVIIMALLLFASGGDPLMRVIGPDVPEDITGGRLHFWQTAWQIFLDHPLIGAGLDAFSVAYTNHDTWSGALRVEHAHNDYLQILADAGIVGLICVGVFIFLFVRSAMHVIGASRDGFRRGAAIGAAAGCLGIMVHSFVDFPLRTPANGFVFLLLAAIAVANVQPDIDQR